MSKSKLPFEGVEVPDKGNREYAEVAFTSVSQLGPGRQDKLARHSQDTMEISELELHKKHLQKIS